MLPDRRQKRKWNVTSCSCKAKLGTLCTEKNYLLVTFSFVRVSEGDRATSPSSSSRNGFIDAVIHLRGRRTPHQDLEGPLIEITQPSISNRWATGGPPLVLISHPNGMAPDEERFYTENRSTWLSPDCAWIGTPICPHLGRKRNKGMAHYRCFQIVSGSANGT